MKIINSPNYDQRPDNTIIDTIIIHHTKMPDYISALKRLCDPEAKVSAHYLINKQGEIFSIVSESSRAWHAGASYWRGREKVNDFSIGIELDNNGEEEFSNDLMNSLIKLCKQIIKNHPIDQFNIIGHSDIAPGRKDDPGGGFDWELLAKNNIGIMPFFSSSLTRTFRPEIGGFVRYTHEIPGQAASQHARDDELSVLPQHARDDELSVHSQHARDDELNVYSAITNNVSQIPEVKIIQTMLFKYGYKIEITGEKDKQTLDVMKAFNEHFNQKCIIDWDLNSQSMLEGLIKLL